MLIFSDIAPLVISGLGAIGFATILAQWLAAGKDRRIARADFLTKLQRAELSRLPTGKGRRQDTERLRSSLRELESTALAARIPRFVVTRYMQLSIASLRYALNDLDRAGGDLDLAGLPVGLYGVLIRLADLASRAAWSPQGTRIFRLRFRLWLINNEIRRIVDTELRSHIETAEKQIP